MARLLPRLRYVHTTAPLIRATDELLQELPSVVQPGDPLIVNKGIPLVMCLARATPFVGHPYPDLVGVPRLRAYWSSADCTDPWQIWIRAKYMPAEDFDITRSEGSDFGQTQQTRAWPAAFLREHGYHGIWENALVEISVPAHAHARGGQPRGSR